MASRRLVLPLLQRFVILTYMHFSTVPCQLQLKERIRKGIPDSFRVGIYQLILGSKEFALRKENRNLFQVCQLRMRLGRVCAAATLSLYRIQPLLKLPICPDMSHRRCSTTTRSKAIASSRTLKRQSSGIFTELCLATPFSNRGILGTLDAHECTLAESNAPPCTRVTPSSSPVQRLFVQANTAFQRPQGLLPL